MLRWLFGKDEAAEKEEAPGPSTPAPEDEWAYLRTRPDFDEEEMSSVHANDSLVPDPSSADLSRLPGAREESTAWVAPSEQEVLKVIEQHADQPIEVENSAGEAARRVQNLKIEVSSARRKFPWLVRDEALVGRRDFARGIHPEIDLFMDPSVSASQAWIGRVGGRFVLRELRSEAVTRVNGRVLTPGEEVVLRNGDRVQLGQKSIIRVLEAPGSHHLSAEDVVLGELLQDALGQPNPDEPDEPADPLCTAPR